MPKFAYVARHPTTLKTTQGVIRASTVEQARSILRNQKLVISRIKESKPGFLEKLNTPKVNVNEIITLLTLLEGSLSSGMTIKETFTILQKQTQHPTLKQVLEEIMTSIEEGTDLSTSFAKHDLVFPSYVPPMIKAGEASGMLPEILRQMTLYMEKVNELRKRIVGLFVYPAIVLSFAVLLVIVMVVFVMPRFQSIFTTFNAKLPPPTRILLGLSGLVTHHTLPLLLGLGGIVFGAVAFYKNPKGKFLCHLWQLRMPLLGSFFSNVYMLRIVQTMSILLRSGLTMLEALQIVQRATANLPIHQIIEQMRVRVIKGLTLAEPLMNNPKIIPPIVAYSVAVGEKNGNLPDLMANLARLLERDLDHTAKRVSSTIDPIMTMLIGGIVLFIALAIYLPIFDAMAAMGKGG